MFGTWATTSVWLLSYSLISLTGIRTSSLHLKAGTQTPFIAQQCLKYVCEVIFLGWKLLTSCLLALSLPLCACFLIYDTFSYLYLRLHLVDLTRYGSKIYFFNSRKSPKAKLEFAVHWQLFTWYLHCIKYYKQSRDDLKCMGGST